MIERIKSLRRRESMACKEDNFEANYLYHRHRVLQLCRQMLGNGEDAEDACQEIYMRLWEQRHKLSEVRQPLPFVIRVARNYCLDKLRVFRAPHFTLEETFQSDTISAEDEDKQREEDLLNEVERWSHTLAEPQKSIFAWVHYEGMRISDIALRLNLTEVNVRVTLSRLRKQIKEKLQNE